MAIQFARCEFVSRSTGGNACRKAAYNQREAISCGRTGEIFSFKGREGNAHHEILLPSGVKEKFKDSEVLWNAVEHAERRINSQVAKEFVLALPDDKVVSLEDRIELTRRFCRAQFTDRGVAVQMDLHEPHDGEKNWHAHLLVTTRRFTEDGNSLGLKARDLNPQVRSRKVVEGDLWGEFWRDMQNAYFEEKGYELRVDPLHILAQEHLGPVRMRHHLNEAVERAQELQKLNEELSRDPRHVLEALTRTRAIVSEKDVKLFLEKNLPNEETEHVFERVMHHSSCVLLYDKDTGEKTPYFTIRAVRAEEEKLMRFADKIAGRSREALAQGALDQECKEKNLSEEQRQAFDLATSGANLSVIQGRAGVGKSYVLSAIRDAHEENGYRVLGLAPTHKVTQDLAKDGFEAQTCHSFLFALRANRERINHKTLVVIDEAGMLGSSLTVELLHAVKTRGAKLLLVGDDRQLRSVDRGGAFRVLAERYSSVELNEVRRQTISWQKVVSENLSKGDIKSAVHLLQDNKAIIWSGSKEEALATLLKDWAKSKDLNPTGLHQILAQKNVDVDALNQGARDILKSQGRLGDNEITCMTDRGRATFSEGDRIHFTRTDKEQGINNGTFGTIESLDPKTKKITVLLDNNNKVEFDPHTYTGLRHGYASTVYKAQGVTLSHVHVLHTPSTNKSTSYVALSRQTKSLSLYVSNHETPSLNHLIKQMSRDSGNTCSLVYDTQKDIDLKKGEKTLSYHIKENVEALFTKVKDTFHRNEDFYRFEAPKAQTQDVTFASSQLQSVYEEMTHPAFSTSEAQVVKKAFEKGLEVHGEDQAIAYWNSAKTPLLRPYQKNMARIETELHSSAFKNRSEKWKDQARELARQDPLKMLENLKKMKKELTLKREKQQTRTLEFQQEKEQLQLFDRGRDGLSL